MRTITLELLRHGPAHNQLLSPLTPYLALCENHAAVTLHVPFEHNQFLHRLSALGYKLGDESRIFQLQDTAQVLGKMLGEIPGLTAESNKVASSENQLTHLRLIISASELALLPFELALSPAGLPGSGQHLLLQPQMPLCLTREVRRVQGEQLQWPLKPRILFVAASPTEVGQIPLESHLLALRRVISPWVKYYDTSDFEMQRRRVEDHLTLLPGASIEAIEQACASNAYTHIHILAHGIQRTENYNTRFFLALHNAFDPNKADYISGERLATALRPSQRPDSESLAKPVVVTLASCDSANGGSVAGAGASIAHALHESGIPMVVAGQFPLSFEGSVRLVECLYEGLLWGNDPRPLLYDLRRRLYAQFQKQHDWASLTAYMSLPIDFDKQLSSVQIDQAMRSINAAMNHADEVTRRLIDRIRTKRLQEEQQYTSPAEMLKILEIARKKINNAKQRLERLLDRIPNQRVRILGLLASTEKRQAEVIFQSTKKSLANHLTFNLDKDESLQLLHKARDHYWSTFLLDRSTSWALVQYLSLALIFYKIKTYKTENLSFQQSYAGHSTENDEQPEKKFTALWSLAHQLSLYDLNSNNHKLTIWAHGNLIELYLLSMIIPFNDALPNPDKAELQALDHTDSLIAIAGRNSFDVYSTRRQVLRYVEWFSEIADLNQIPRIAIRIFERFPDEIEEAWK